MTRPALSLFLLLLSGVCAHAQDPRDAYLDALATAARATRPNGRALALAHTALANVRAGRVLPATALAKAAADGAVARDRYGVEALTLAGAAMGRAGNDGTIALRAGLERVSRMAEADRAGGLVAWLAGLAESPDRALLDQGLLQLRSLPADRQAVVLKDALPSIRRLGADEAVAAIARELLQAHLGLLFYPEVVIAVDTLGGLPTGGSAVVWERIFDCRDEIDEFSVPCMAIALKGEREPWSVAVTHADALSSDGHAYAALLVRLAGVLRLVDDRHPSAGDRLEETLEAAWSHPPGRDPARPSTEKDDATLQRVRVLYRLIPKIPEACARDRAVALLTRELERASSRERHPYIVNELLGHIATAAQELPADDRADLVQAVVSRTLAEHRRAAVVPAVLFEALSACARTIAVHGDRESGLPLIDRISERALEAIAAVPIDARGDPNGGRIFFPVQTLLACSRAARRLGDATRGDRLLDAGLSTIGELEGLDQADSLVDAFSSAGEVEGAARWAVAMRVLAACRSMYAMAQPWELGNVFAAAARIVQ